MQQNYSKMSGLTESLSVVDLVEDAIRMNNAALVRHDVQLVANIPRPRRSWWRNTRCCKSS